MKAVIMAGGKGTRLRPLTSNQPKPMISIVNKPCMEHILELLRRHGFTRVKVTLEYMPEVIQGYFGDGSEWGMNIEYSVAEEPLGTAGSVKYVENRLGERFVIVSGDALTNVDLTEALSFHEERGAEATLVLKKVDDPSGFGIVTVEEDGRVTDFMEKPDEEEVFSYTANTGIYILEPSVLDDIPEGQEYDWSKEQFPKMLEEGRPLYGYVTESYWEDIGNIEQYMGAQRAVLDGEVEGVEPAGEGASIVRSTVGGESTIGEEAELDGALIMRACNIGPRARVLEGSALGDGTRVGEGATVAAGASVLPGESIEEGDEVTEDAS